VTAIFTSCKIEFVAYPNDQKLAVTLCHPLSPWYTATLIQAKEFLQLFEPLQSLISNKINISTNF
jgi:hypothetical protein